MALMLAASLQGLAASGHFPRQPGAAWISGFGRSILFGSITLGIAGLAGGIPAALWVIPWYAAVIGGGLSVLAAPLVLQLFPDRFVDGRGSLLVFATLSAVLALWLVWLAI
jgi:hypothetical protein